VLENGAELRKRIQTLRIFVSPSPCAYVPQVGFVSTVRVVVVSATDSASVFVVRLEPICKRSNSSPYTLG
jgi:hypothetical protein